jgi:phosphate/sulfate permease
LFELKSTQRFGPALILGVTAMLVAAVLWAAISYVSGWKIGFMAIGVGALVGFAVKIGGRGVTPLFGVMGATLAVVGCVAGDVFAVAAFVARQYDEGLFEVLSRLTVPVAVEILRATFQPIDVLFYAIAIYFGYKFSFARITPEHLRAVAARRLASTASAGNPIDE